MLSNLGPLFFILKNPLLLYFEFLTQFYGDFFKSWTSISQSPRKVLSTHNCHSFIHFRVVNEPVSLRPLLYLIGCSFEIYRFQHFRQYVFGWEWPNISSFRLLTVLYNSRPCHWGKLFIFFDLHHLSRRRVIQGKGSFGELAFWEMTFRDMTLGETIFGEK